MAKEKNEKTTSKKIKPIYIVLAILIVVCISLIIYLIMINRQTLTPDYAPGTIDVNAIKEKDSGEKMAVSQGGGAVSIAYSNIVSVDKKNKTLKLYFKNPSVSRESIVLEVIVLQGDKEYVIAQSELLPPGYALYKLDLNTKIKLSVGGYKGKFRTTYSNEETGEKEIVNTEIEASIEVK